MFRTVVITPVPPERSATADPPVLRYFPSRSFVSRVPQNPMIPVRYGPEVPARMVGAEYIRGHGQMEPAWATGPSRIGRDTIGTLSLHDAGGMRGWVGRSGTTTRTR